MWSHLARRFLLVGSLAAGLAPRPSWAQSADAPVRVERDSTGLRLTVGGRPLMINGVNWDYVPIGENYAYSLWTQPDAIIREALEREMRLVRRMGANAIRVYAGIPPRWVRHI